MQHEVLACVHAACSVYVYVHRGRELALHCKVAAHLEPGEWLA
jgi:hypothetical protein